MGIVILVSSYFFLWSRIRSFYALLDYRVFAEKAVVSLLVFPLNVVLLQSVSL
jgi:hypothetical protein